MEQSQRWHLLVKVLGSAYCPEVISAYFVQSQDSVVIQTATIWISDPTGLYWPLLVSLDTAAQWLLQVLCWPSHPVQTLSRWLWAFTCSICNAENIQRDIFCFPFIGPWFPPEIFVLLLTAIRWYYFTLTEQHMWHSEMDHYMGGFNRLYYVQFYVGDWCYLANKWWLVVHKLFSNPFIKILIKYLPYWCTSKKIEKMKILSFTHPHAILSDYNRHTPNKIFRKINL